MDQNPGSRLTVKRQDLLRRFTETPLTTDFQLLGRTLRLETNSRDLLELVLKFFACYQHGSRTESEFSWRLVSEADSGLSPGEIQVSAFSDSGHHYVNFGHRSFIAVDLDKREAIGFLADRFLEGNPRFRHRPPLDILFCMTAPSLGATVLSGACVGLADQGVLIFGLPNSGKTTTGYLAAKLGLNFHGDQVIFLDTSSGDLRAWGDPFPAVFRPEGARFLPELKEIGHASNYGDLSFLYVDKGSHQTRYARPISPVCSVFLDRNGPAKPRLVRVSDDRPGRLHACRLFCEDPRFKGQTNSALSALAQMPMYEFSYENNPQFAADFIKELLP